VRESAQPHPLSGRRGLMKPTSSSTATPPTRPPAGPTPAPKGGESASFAETLARGGGAPPAAPVDPQGKVDPAVAEDAALPPLPDAESGVDAAETPGQAPAATVQEASVESAEPAGPPAGRGAGEGFGTQRGRARPDALDPATRHAAQMAPMFAPPEAFTSTTASSPAAAPAETQAHASMESMLPDMVRKIAWSGDGKRGSMRLELGAGALAGGTLLVHADEGRVSVELNAPSGTDVNAWKERLEERLERRGVAVDEVVVK